MLRSFASAIRDNEDNSAELVDPAYKLMWNGGQPFVQDILNFLDESILPSMDKGQMAYRQITDDDEDWFDQYDWSDTVMKWNRYKQSAHRLILLCSDRFWYARHFRDIRDRQLFAPHAFNDDGSWREVRSINKETFQIS